MQISSDEMFMQLAIEEAEHAARKGEVPVGAVIVYDDQVIARAHNLRESLQDPTLHAETIALREAAKRLSTWRLENTTLYVTLEPCPMCAGALILSRVPRVVYGCDDPKAGAVKSLYTIGSDPRLNHRFELVSGVLSEKCAELLSQFFASIRAARRQGTQENNECSEPNAKRR